MNTKISVLFAAMFLNACTQVTTENNTDRSLNVKIQPTLNQVQAIPKPSDMVADVITNARVSTVKNVEVAYVGKQIPFTFSTDKVTNTLGFEWYVSKHFALKTDYPAEKAQFFLELLELSYPYYVEFFGMEPPNIHNQRIASTYATNNDKLRTAMFDDGFNRGIHHTAGGEAMYYNWVGYSFPTERPQHQRYISIHETMHSYQMALGNYPWTPSWHGEGLGDATANHIFDSKKKQLTVFGHDVPIFDMMSWALDTYEKEKPSIVDIHNRKKFDRGLNVLFVQFMYNNPEYSQYMKIYHQEVMQQQTDSRTRSLAILQQIVPDWKKLEKNFVSWIADIKQTHIVASRGQWEMDGNMFYKRKSDFDYAPQRVGFTMTPAQTPSYTMFNIDFPQPDPSELLLPAKRGVAEPVISYELNYQNDSLDQGKLGMAFGVQLTADNAAAIKNSYRSWKGANTDLDEQLRIEIEHANNLVIDGSLLGIQLAQYALPADIVNSLKQQARSQKDTKLGVSVQFKKQAIEVTVKAINAAPFTITQAISQSQHEKLVNREFGLISSNNHHGITPYIDDGRDLNPNSPDLNTTTAPNAWGFKGDKLAQRFARANWKSAKQTPHSWRNAFAELNQAALTPTTAQETTQAVIARLPELAKEGTHLNSALAELSGIQLQLDWLGDSIESMQEYAIITNHSEQDIQANIIFNVADNTSEQHNLSIRAGEKTTVKIDPELLAKGNEVTANLNYEWHTIDIKQTLSQKTKKYNGFEIPEISATYEEGQLHINTQLNGPFAGKTTGTITVDLHHGSKLESVSNPVKIAPYEEQFIVNKFKIEEKELDHDAWYEVTVVADSDGEPIMLRKRLPYIPAKFTR